MGHIIDNEIGLFGSLFGLVVWWAYLCYIGYFITKTVNEEKLRNKQTKKKQNKKKNE